MASTPSTSTASASISNNQYQSIMAPRSAESKEKGSNATKQKVKQADGEELVEVESDSESNSALIIDEPTEKAVKQSSAAEQAVESTHGDISLVPLATVVQAPLEVKK